MDNTKTLQPHKQQKHHWQSSSCHSSIIDLWVGEGLPRIGQLIHGGGPDLGFLDSISDLFVDPGLGDGRPLDDALREPQCDLALSVLDGIGAVDDVAADVDRVVAADRAGGASLGLGGACEEEEGRRAQGSGWAADDKERNGAEERGVLSLKQYRITACTPLSLAMPPPGPQLPLKLNPNGR